MFIYGASSIKGVEGNRLLDLRINRPTEPFSGVSTRVVAPSGVKSTLSPEGTYDTYTYDGTQGV